MNTVKKKRQVAGSTLQRKRRSLNMTRAEAALLLNVSESTYRAWETNGAGEQAIAFASGEWDATLKLLADCNSKPLLQSIGKLNAILTEENQANLSASIDQISSDALLALINALNK